METYLSLVKQHLTPFLDECIHTIVLDYIPITSHELHTINDNLLRIIYEYLEIKTFESQLEYNNEYEEEYDEEEFVEKKYRQTIKNYTCNFPLYILPIKDLTISRTLIKSV